MKLKKISKQHWARNTSGPLAERICFLMATPVVDIQRCATSQSKQDIRLWFWDYLQLFFVPMDEILIEK